MGKRILVTGAGGFIGGHLVRYLKSKRHWVRGVDIKLPEYSTTAADEFQLLDLRDATNALIATNDVDEVYGLAADMGGMGYLSFHHADVLHNNALININTLHAAKLNGVKKYLYTSSACVYPEYRQDVTDVTALKESDAYPAQPENAYGWEKLVFERMCMHYRIDHGIDTRIIRFHNIFGPLGTWDGERAKAPAAICRKVAIAKLSRDNTIEIWGDGEQTRSFCFVDDAVLGMYKLMNSSHTEPLNLGQDRLISLNGLVDIVSKIAGITPVKKYIEGPQGVRGRNSDNTLIRQVLKWEPQVSLETGLRITYDWIYLQVQRDILERLGNI